MTTTPPRAVPAWKQAQLRRRRRNRVGVVAAGALVVAGFAGYGVAHGLASGPLAVATAPKPPLYQFEPDEAVVTGTLRGSVGTVEDAGTACFWLEGTGADRSYVVWPHGWSATDHPLRVLDD